MKGTFEKSLETVLIIRRKHAIAHLLSNWQYFVTTPEQRKLWVEILVDAMEAQQFSDVSGSFSTLSSNLIRDVCLPEDVSNNLTLVRACIIMKRPRWNGIVLAWSCIGRHSFTEKVC